LNLLKPDHNLAFFLKINQSILNNFEESIQSQMTWFLWYFSNIFFLKRLTRRGHLPKKVPLWLNKIQDSFDVVHGYRKTIISGNLQKYVTIRWARFSSHQIDPQFLSHFWPYSICFSFQTKFSYYTCFKTLRNDVYWAFDWSYQNKQMKQINSSWWRKIFKTEL